MSTFTGSLKKPQAAEIKFDASMLRVRLTDGRELAVPLEWFPKLRDATKKQRENYSFIGNGIGIHWEDLDEDISVKALF